MNHEIIFMLLVAICSYYLSKAINVYTKAYWTYRKGLGDGLTKYCNYFKVEEMRVKRYITEHPDCLKVHSNFEVSINE